MSVNGGGHLELIVHCVILHPLKDPYEGSNLAISSGITFYCPLYLRCFTTRPLLKISR